MLFIIENLLLNPVYEKIMLFNLLLARGICFHGELHQLRGKQCRCRSVLSPGNMGALHRLQTARFSCPVGSDSQTTGLGVSEFKASLQ